MKWKKYTIHTTTEAEDIVSLMLNELGVEGVQIENNVPLSDADTKGMFIDILPELGEDDGTSRVSFFLHLEENDGAESGSSTAAAAAEAGNAAGHGVGAEADKAAGNPDKAAVTGACDNSYTIADKIWTETEIGELLAKVREGLEEIAAYADIGEGRIEEGVTEDADWRDNWKQYFKPIQAGNFLIKPTWEDIPNEVAAEAASGALKVIEIDPGTAFGTGSHETTQLCLKAIEKYVGAADGAGVGTAAGARMRVLDVGTGSGILGIAALKEGAAYCMATEVDEMCESSIMDNIGFNDITENEFELLIGNIIDDPAVRRVVHEAALEGFDIAIANILAPVIVMLAGKGQIDSFVKAGGIFITSGIIDTKEAEVTEAFQSNPAWEILEINHQGEWVSVVARRH